MSKKMRIRIGRDGRTEIKVEGGQGDDCIAFTRTLEEALGQVEQRELTADYHDAETLAVPAREELKERGL